MKIITVEKKRRSIAGQPWSRGLTSAELEARRAAIEREYERQCAFAALVARGASISNDENLWSHYSDSEWQELVAEGKRLRQG